MRHALGIVDRLEQRAGLEWRDRRVLELRPGTGSDDRRGHAPPRRRELSRRRPVRQPRPGPSGDLRPPRRCPRRARGRRPARLHARHLPRAARARRRVRRDREQRDARASRRRAGGVRAAPRAGRAGRPDGAPRRRPDPHALHQGRRPAQHLALRRPSLSHGPDLPRRPNRLRGRDFARLAAARAGRTSRSSPAAWPTRTTCAGSGSPRRTAARPTSGSSPSRSPPTPPERRRQLRGEDPTSTSGAASRAL